jgi:hypothetical protein
MLRVRACFMLARVHTLLMDKLALPYGLRVNTPHSPVRKSEKEREREIKKEREGEREREREGERVCVKESEREIVFVFQRNDGTF